MSAAPNLDSVRLFVRDASDGVFCYSCADNRPDVIAGFRKHATWWKGYARSHEGQKTLAARGHYPVFPLETVVEPYDSREAMAA